MLSKHFLAIFNWSLFGSLFSAAENIRMVLGKFYGFKEWVGEGGGWSWGLLFPNGIGPKLIIFYRKI